MGDTREKSTKVPDLDAAYEEVAPGVFLDGRLALHHPEEGWLAISDLHFGYEVSRRRDGGLWPMWGMESLSERLRLLVKDLRPETLILAGDIVDSAAAAREAVDWLSGIHELCATTILIEGNHDRGEVTRQFPFVPSFETGSFFFHHGHLPLFEEQRDSASGRIEVTGHRHPSVRLNDGAGTSLKLPALTMEERPDQSSSRWILPAFSPWAGGVKYQPDKTAIQFRQWACSSGRVFEIHT
ncbi:MAG: metallophosphoesterase [Verrucomicrobiales bacterium]|nr:metallophosphoesterase [Verrucomicrobiales bacterium]